MSDDNREALYELADRFVTDRPLKSEMETFGQFDRRHVREFLVANRDAVLRALNDDYHESLGDYSLGFNDGAASEQARAEAAERKVARVEAAIAPWLEESSNVEDAILRTAATTIRAALADEETP